MYLLFSLWGVRLECPIACGYLWYYSFNICLCNYKLYAALTSDERYHSLVFTEKGWNLWFKIWGNQSHSRFLWSCSPWSSCNKYEVSSFSNLFLALLYLYEHYCCLSWAACIINITQWALKKSWHVYPNSSLSCHLLSRCKCIGNM